MSGPKDFSYAIEARRREAERQRLAEERRRREEAERQRQLLLAAQRRCANLSETLEKLSSSLAKYGVALPQTVSQGALDSIERCAAMETKLQNAVKAAETELSREVAKVLVNQVGMASDSIAGETRKVIDLLVKLHDADLRATLISRAQAVGQVSNRAQAEADLLALKTQVVKALDAQEYQRLAQAAVTDFKATVGGGLNDLQLQANNVVTKSELTMLQTKIAQKQTEHQTQIKAQEQIALAQWEKRYVQEQLESVLTELGLEVGPGFEPIDKFGSVIIPEVPDFPGYGLRVQLQPDVEGPQQGHIRTRIVAENPATPADFEQVERESCADVHALAAKLTERGVAMRLGLARQPGETAAQQATAPIRKKRTTTRAQVNTQARAR